MKNSKNAVVMVVLLGTLLSGCATRNPSFGDSVRAEGIAVKDIGESWEKGKAMIRKGNKLVRKGNEQIAAGKENVSDGTSMVKTGEKLVADAERAYELSKFSEQDK